jgi:solute carrier family 25 phosphate transporter 23/24/25/41
MWEEEGFKGFMRGNGINCLRIVPYSAVQFTTYEQLKKVRVIYRFLEALINFS